MKKLHLTTILLTVVLTASFGQKVDLDKFNFTFEYRDLPTMPQNAEYNTYSVKVNAASNIRNNFGESGIEDAVNMEGWKKISGATGHFVVSLTLDDLIISSSQINERVDVQKDKEGKETGRKYYYAATANYSWSGKAVVKDFRDATIGNFSLGSSTTKTWTSSEYSTRKEAADYYNNNRESLRDKFVRDEVTAGINELNSWLSSTYGYSNRKEYEIFWILDAKKHPETQAQKDMWETFKQAVATVTPDALSEETKEKFSTVIKYFDEIPSRFTTADKGDKKMRYASYYNKAKIYLYLDNPEAAIKEAESLIANDYDTGDGKRLKKEAEALAELFKKNNKSSRHFQIDLSSATAPTL